MELISTAQAAEILGCIPASIFVRVRKGLLTPLNKSGEAHQWQQSMYFPLETVNALREEEQMVLGRTASEDWLTPAETMAILGVNKKSVARLARIGRLKGEKRYTGLPGSGDQWVFRRVDVLACQGGHVYRPRKAKTSLIVASRDALIWVAGYFDGEGCILISSARNGYKWSLQISLTNTARKEVTRLQGMFGGRLYDVPVHGTNRRPQRKWSTTGRQARNVLVTLLPFLRQKAEQARIAIEFQDRVDRACNNGHRPILPEDRVWREQAYERLKWLHHHDEED